MWFRMPALVEAIMIFHISAVITGGIINGSSISARITAAPRDAAVQEQRHRESQPDLDDDRHQRESERELERAGEQRLADQVDVVVEPDEAEAFGILQPIAGEAVVQPQAERVDHPHEQNQSRRQQQVRQELLAPPVPGTRGVLTGRYRYLMPASLSTLSTSVLAFLSASAADMRLK